MKRSKMKKLLCLGLVMALLAEVVQNQGGVSQAATKESFISMGNPKFDRLSIYNGQLYVSVVCQYKEYDGEEEIGTKVNNMDVDGYEIQCSTSSDFSSEIKLETTSSGRFGEKKVASGKTYYVRGRGYVDIYDLDTQKTTRQYSGWVKSKIAYPSKVSAKKAKSYKYKVKLKKKGTIQLTWDKKSFPKQKNVHYGFLIVANDKNKSEVQFTPEKKEMGKRVMVCKEKIFKKGMKIKVYPYVVLAKKFSYWDGDKGGEVFISGKTKTFKL